MTSYIEVKESYSYTPADDKYLGIDTRALYKNRRLRRVNRCRGRGRLGWIRATRTKSKRNHQEKYSGHQCQRAGTDMHRVKFVTGY
jgi:hypothetical protein